MPSSLTVNGTAYGTAGRKTNSLVLDAWGWDYDGDYWCEFHEEHASAIPKFLSPYSVSLTDQTSTLVFTGQIADVQPGWSQCGRTWGYRCEGLKYVVNQAVPVTATDGSGLSQYNLSVENEDYIAANAGRTVGQILTDIFTNHSTALSAVGVSTDATTTTQLAAMTLVPNDPVYIQGERLWIAVDNFLSRWYRNYRSFITPGGKIRFIDITTGSNHTLTLNTDPVDWPLFSRSWREAATRVVSRGKGKIYPAYVSLGESTLVAAWSGAQQTAWKWSDFANPAGASDTGAITTVNSATQITVQSSDAALTWTTNYWNGIQGWVYCIKSAASGLAYQESRPITACSSMSAGGTATLTLGFALDNSAAGSYTSYKIIALSPGLSASSPLGRNNVHRLYNVVTPGTYIEQHLVKRFPVAVPYLGVNNLATMTTVPMATIYKSQVGWPATFKIIPAAGQILFDRPIVEQLNSQSILNVGGTSVVTPDDLVMLLAYSRGALTAPYPPDSGGPVYSGTAYSASGLQRTKTIDVDSWSYEGNTSVMVSLAEMVQTSTRDTKIEGSVRYKGYYSTVADPSGGHTLSFNKAAGTTGDESLAIPVRSATFRYETDGSSGLLYSTEMWCSTRKDPRTGEGFYQHLSVLGSGAVVGTGGSPFGEGYGPTVGGGANPMAQYNAMIANYGQGGPDMTAGMGGGGNGRYRRRAPRRGYDASGPEIAQVGAYDRTPNSYGQNAAQLRHQDELEGVRAEGRRKGSKQKSDVYRARLEGYGKSVQPGWQFPDTILDEDMHDPTEW